ncbi:MAG: amino acid adenylation domain-containing protein, partial [Burkholderiaceae bacterium]|nr:amino acid adenylation domain-containing protein [Burkholderiaceae bacterium]
TLGIELPLRALFEAPTIAELAARVQALDLGPRDDADRAAAAAAAPIPATGALSGPLSPAQEALWIVERVDADSGSRYNIAVALRLRGPVQVPALRTALRALLRRHAALRTAIREVGGEPVQFVLDDDEPDFEVVDAGTASDFGGKPHPVAPLLHLAAHEPFDLAAGRLLRTRLIRSSPTDHALLLVVHHIVSDGLSTTILERELGALYAAALPDAAVADAVLDALLPPLPISFLDYAIWSRADARGPRTRRQLGYWVSHLSGAPDHDLPFDRPRPASPELGAGTHSVAIAADTARALASVASSNGATPYMVMMSALRILLARYGAGNDAVIGTPNGGRDRAELEDLVGYFVDMQPMRSSLAGDPTFVELLRRVRRDTLDAWAHRDASFDRIVAAVNPPREPGRNPLFQVTFAMQTGDDAPVTLPGLQVEPLSIGSGRAKFDLSLLARLCGERLQLHFTYDRDLFDHVSIERMGTHLRNLLDAIAAAPQARLSGIPMLEAAERERLVAGFNPGARPFPEDASLPQLFEEQVARTSQAVAIVCGDERLDYATLNRRANRLAHRLRRLGVGPDVPVGLYLQRGPGMVVAMLGVLKAGGAYVPIDIDYPPERIAFMLADSAAAVTIVEQSLAPRLAGMGSHLLDLDDPSLKDEPSDNPAALCRPEHLAYLIYTSGSTGRPKGVMIPHRAVVRLVRDTDYVSLAPGDCVAQASNAAFDAATFEIWGALLNGARIAVVATDTLLSATALERQLARDGITTMFVTTALFNEHAARAPWTFHGLRELLFGGEAVDPEAVARVLRDRPPQRLLHVYGPTETTTFATWHEVPPTSGPGRTPDTVPIGRPIANTSCHVLDDTLQPVPVGVPGELCIGGPGLARGYLNRPELTAERFVPDPFVAGQRLYRSGDRVRRLSDGSIVFLGRNDEQVKLRGFRIELGEIRTALAVLPGVAQSALMVREDRPGEHRLVAYLVRAADAPALSLAQLRGELAERLPSFMIPAAFVTLDALPLTANGKLDLRALPAPPAGALSADDSPTDAVERELREIWESVLNVRGIGLDADFFELGGHSMLAVRVLAEVDRRMGRQLRTAAFFEAPTIRRFAALLRQAPAAPTRASCVVTVQPGDGRRPLFFVSGWGGQLIVLNDLAKALGPRQGLHVLDTGVFGADASGLTLEAIAARMVEDLRRIQPTGPYRLAGYSMGGKIVHEIAQQLYRSGERVAVLAILDTGVSARTRRRSAPVRVLLHLREALRMRPAQMLAYLAGRARWMVRHLLGHDDGLFHGEDVERTAVALAIERSARAVLAAWSDYQPRHYPGRVLLIRAEKQAPLVGIVPDPDPTYGWGALSGEGVELRSMHCRHNRMLHPPHVAELARILAEAIAHDDASGARPSSRTGRPARDRAAA